MKSALFAAGSAGLLLVGCSLTPDYVQPRPPIADHWPEQHAGDDGIPGQVTPLADWQHVFLDEHLRALIKLSLEHNQNLGIAIQRIEEARAFYGVQQANQFPGLGVRAMTQRQQVSALDSITGKRLIPETGRFSLGLGITAFELDVWGRVQALTESADQQYQASQSDAHAVHMRLVSEVAVAYYEALTYIRLQQLNVQLLTAAQTSRSLISRRFELGVASELDVLQAQAMALTLEAEVADATRQQNLSTNKLRLLLGTDFDVARLNSGSLDTEQILAPITSGLSSALLARRPDVRAAESRLKAMNANIGAARAAFFPAISLTGFFGFSSPQLNQLFSGAAKSWSFNPQVDLSIFDFGRKRSQLELSLAQKEIATSEYQQVIQEAFREVADTLGSSKPINDQLIAQKHLITNELRRVELSNRLYEDGLNSYIEVLDAQRGLSGAQQAMLKTRLLQLSNRIGLYRSLGGGWS